MANLMFKMGEWSKLASTTKKAGTIYVTKDQHSMYVDISDTERIKLQGTVVAYDNLTDFGASVLPPYDTSVIYFIANRNALVRWDAAADEGKGAWVQLNTPASSLQSVVESVNSLAGTVSDIETAIGSDDVANSIKGRLTAVENKATQNATDIVTANGKIDALQADLDTAETGLKARMTAAEGRLDSAEGRLDSAEGSISDLEGRVDGHDTAIQGLTNADTAITGRLDTAEGKITAAEGKITSAEGRLDTAEGKITSAEGRLDTAEGQISDLDGKIAANAGEITGIKNRLTTAEGNITAIDGRVTTAEGKITAAEGRLGTAEGKISSLEGKMTTAEGNISDLEGKMTTAEGDISTLKGNVTALQNADVALDGRVTANTNAIGSDDVAGSVKGRIKALETSTGDLGTRVGTLEGSVSDLDTAVNGEYGLNNRMTAVEEKANDNATAISNLITEVANNDTAIAKNAEDIAKNAEDIAKNAEDIATNSGSISDIEKEIEVINELLGAGGGAEGTDSIATRLTNVEKKADDNATAIGNLTTSVGTLTTGVADNKAATEKNAEDIATNAGAISDLDAKVTNDYALKTEVEQVEEDLTAVINAQIRAANSMQYKTSVDSFDDLPVIADNIKIGDTYVVASAFEVLDGDSVIYYQAGDLIIASGDESEETGFISENLVWNRVETGFKPELEPIIEVNNNVISLTGGTGNDLGSVTLVSANEGLTIETDGSTITFNMVWGEF